MFRSFFTPGYYFDNSFDDSDSDSDNDDDWFGFKKMTPRFYPNYFMNPLRSMRRRKNPFFMQIEEDPFKKADYLLNQKKKKEERKEKKKVSNGIVTGVSKSSFSSNVNGNLKKLETKKITFKDGSEKIVFQRRLGDKIFTEVTQKNEKGDETVSKYFKNLKKQDELEFLKDWESSNNLKSLKESTGSLENKPEELKIAEQIKKEEEEKKDKELTTSEEVVIEEKQKKE